jgi:hypothetical protein
MKSDPWTPMQQGKWRWQQARVVVKGEADLSNVDTCRARRWLAFCCPALVNTRVVP